MLSNSLQYCVRFLNVCHIVNTMLSRMGNSEMSLMITLIVFIQFRGLLLIEKAIFTGARTDISSRRLFTEGVLLNVMCSAVKLGRGTSL